MPNHLWDLTARRLTYLHTPLPQVPIYLVSPETIDRSHIPQTSGIARKCHTRTRKTLRVRLEAFDPKSTSISDVVDELYKQCRREVKVLTLYLPEVATSLSAFPSLLRIQSEPTILICSHWRWGRFLFQAGSPLKRSKSQRLQTRPRRSARVKPPEVICEVCMFTLDSL